MGLSKVTSDRARHSYQAGAVLGGATIGVKQMAEDFKAGLLTFVEDLRQATVGDEATQREGSLDSLVRDVSKNIGTNRNGPPMGMNGAKKPTTATPVRRQPSHTKKAPEITARPLTPPPKAPINSTVDDDWSNWDSPTSSKEESPRWSNSTMISDNNTSHSEASG
jgi:hypothetical protein